MRDLLLPGQFPGHVYDQGEFGQVGSLKSEAERQRKRPAGFVDIFPENESDDQQWNGYPEHDLKYLGVIGVFDAMGQVHQSQPKGENDQVFGHIIQRVPLLVFIGQGAGGAVNGQQ